MTPSRHHTPRWQVWVDTGGTFTDCVALDPEGGWHRAKVLSTSCLRARLASTSRPDSWCLERLPDLPAGFFPGAAIRKMQGTHCDSSCVVRAHPLPDRIVLDAPLPSARPGDAVELRFDEPAPCLAARLVTKTPRREPLPPMQMRLATTRGTNALLERRGGATVLFVSHGFRDLLAIGTQQRPDLFSLRIERPSPLYACVVEVHERLDATGAVVAPLDLDQLRRDAQAALDRGAHCAAVAFIHAYRNPSHERAARDLLADLGFPFVSCSSDVAPLIKILPRAQTTLVDAYLAPVIREYVQSVADALGTHACLHVMTSAGGLVEASAFHPKDSLLSGPAGGVVGARAAGEAAGHARVISFDMGGTSTDVARIDHELEYVFEHRVGDATLVAPAVAVETVAAGGGSICSFDGYRLRVGPESAGARPGPACYGAGGPLTITDVNLLLGRLVPHRFGIPVEPEAARTALAGVIAELERAGGAAGGPSRLLEGFLRIANERMADAVRRISLRKGYDPADHALVAFGGAGGQCAGAVAALLGIRTIVIPQDAGLLSALGLGRARIERFAQQQILEPYDDALTRLPRWVESLAHKAACALDRDQIPPDAPRFRRTIVTLRCQGQDAGLPIEIGPGVDLRAAFLDRYESQYGYKADDQAIEIESLRVVVAATPAEVPAAPLPAAPHLPEPEQRACFAGHWHSVPVLDRPALGRTSEIRGPAIITDAHGTTVVEPGWSASLHRTGAIILRLQENP